uniref:Uncharacterized protein n=1 Tax=Glypta fumiferanae TaxID=389681 RepID=A0A0F6T1G2_9HYME|nr:hypothetical protein [Glypta fumiferanae]
MHYFNRKDHFFFNHQVSPKVMNILPRFIVYESKLILGFDDAARVNQSHRSFNRMGMYIYILYTSKFFSHFRPVRTRSVSRRIQETNETTPTISHGTGHNTVRPTHYCSPRRARLATWAISLVCHPHEQMDRSLPSPLPAP